MECRNSGYGPVLGFDTACPRSVVSLRRSASPHCRAGMARCRSRLALEGVTAAPGGPDGDGGASCFGRSPIIAGKVTGVEPSPVVRDGISSATEALTAKDAPQSICRGCATGAATTDADSSRGSRPEARTGRAAPLGRLAPVAISVSLSRSSVSPTDGFRLAGRATSYACRGPHPTSRCPSGVRPPGPVEGGATRSRGGAPSTPSCPLCTSFATMVVAGPVALVYGSPWSKASSPTRPSDGATKTETFSWASCRPKGPIGRSAISCAWSIKSTGPCRAALPLTTGRASSARTGSAVAPCQRGISWAPISPPSTVCGSADLGSGGGRSTLAKPSTISDGRGRSIAESAWGAAAACRPTNGAVTAAGPCAGPKPISIAALPGSPCAAVSGSTAALSRACGLSLAGIAVGRSEPPP